MAHLIESIVNERKFLLDPKFYAACLTSMQGPDYLREKLGHNFSELTLPERIVPARSFEMLATDRVNPKSQLLKIVLPVRLQSGKSIDLKFAYKIVTPSRSDPDSDRREVAGSVYIRDRYAQSKRQAPVPYMFYHDPKKKELMRNFVDGATLKELFSEMHSRVESGQHTNSEVETYKIHGQSLTAACIFLISQVHYEINKPDKEPKQENSRYLQIGDIKIIPSAPIHRSLYENAEKFTEYAEIIRKNRGRNPEQGVQQWHADIEQAYQSSPIPDFEKLHTGELVLSDFNLENLATEGIHTVDDLADEDPIGLVKKLVCFDPGFMHGSPLGSLAVFLDYPLLGLSEENVQSYVARYHTLFKETSRGKMLEEELEIVRHHFNCSRILRLLRAGANNPNFASVTTVLDKASEILSYDPSLSKLKRVLAQGIGELGREHAS